MTASIGIFYRPAPRGCSDGSPISIARIVKNRRSIRGTSSSGIEWIDCQDVDAGVISLLRHGRLPQQNIAVVCNFTPVPRLQYRVGVPQGGYWKEMLNSDSSVYGGSGLGNLGGVVAEDVPAHGRFHSLSLTLPPLAVLFFKPAS